MWTEYVCRPYVTPVVDGDRVSRIYRSSLRKVDSTVPYSDDVSSWFFLVRHCSLPIIVDHGSIRVIRNAPERVAC